MDGLFSTREKGIILYVCDDGDDDGSVRFGLCFTLHIRKVPPGSSAGRGGPALQFFKDQTANDVVQTRLLQVRRERMIHRLKDFDFLQHFSKLVASSSMSVNGLSAYFFK